MKVIAVIGTLLVLIQCIQQQEQSKSIVWHSSLESFAVSLLQYTLLGVFFEDGGDCAGELCCALECRNNSLGRDCSNSKPPKVRLHTSTPLQYTMHGTVHILQPSATNALLPECEWLLGYMQKQKQKHKETESSFALALFKVWCKRREWLEVAEYFAEYPWDIE